MKYIILTSLLFIISILTFSQTKYCTKYQNEIIINKHYLTISYNPINKIPNYVAYFITPNNIKGNATREQSFYPEPFLNKKYQSFQSDYSNSGYDRGHMSPAADWKFNKQAMHESFSMANICPQKPNLNRIYWKNVENIERELSQLCDTLYIISGSITTNQKYIKNNVIIPTSFYKTIIGVKKHKVIISIAWLFKNTNDKQPQNQNVKTIKQIEQIINKNLYNNFWFNDLYENKCIYIKTN